MAGHHASTPNFPLAALLAMPRRDMIHELALIPVGLLLPIRLQDTRSRLDHLIVDIRKSYCVCAFFLEQDTQLLCVLYGTAKDKIGRDGRCFYAAMIPSLELLLFLEAICWRLLLPTPTCSSPLSLRFRTAEIVLLCVFCLVLLPFCVCPSL